MPVMSICEASAPCTPTVHLGSMWCTRFACRFSEHPRAGPAGEPLDVCVPGTWHVLARPSSQSKLFALTSRSGSFGRCATASSAQLRSSYTDSWTRGTSFSSSVVCDKHTLALEGFPGCPQTFVDSEAPFDEFQGGLGLTAHKREPF